VSVKVTRRTGQNKASGDLRIKQLQQLNIVATLLTQGNMGTYSFNAFAFGGELDLNRLAIVLGISRKYRWEEPMKLNPGDLRTRDGRRP